VKTLLKQTGNRSGQGTRFFRAWFRLTPDEQKAVFVILLLFTLGVLVRYWHLYGGR
jgi:hypothetical protein